MLLLYAGHYMPSFRNTPPWLAPGFDGIITGTTRALQSRGVLGGIRLTSGKVLGEIPPMVRENTPISGSVYPPYHAILKSQAQPSPLAQMLCWVWVPYA